MASSITRSAARPGTVLVTGGAGYIGSHAARALAVAESVRDPAGYYDNNLEGSLSVLGAMAAERVSRFIFSSTCAISGEPKEVPLSEDLPKNPINAYGETKLAVERAQPHYERAYGIRSVCLRYFNAAGAEFDTIIDTAWQWFRAHPRKYEDRQA
jgi:UDP-glucose 4-epimerase